MTKQNWIQVRDQIEIPPEVWFEYYRENGGIIQDLNDFFHTFSIIIWDGMVVGKKVITFESALNRLYSYYNQKFGT